MKKILLLIVLGFTISAFSQNRAKLFMGANNGGDSFLLDTYTGAKVAYSLRQLKSGITGVIRVRRSNDNAELDFTPTEITDGTLVTWVGVGNDGFITIWYDQSLNGINAIPSATTEQPLIVISGVLSSLSGLPIIDTGFDANERGFRLDFGGTVLRPNSFFISINIVDISAEFFDRSPPFSSRLLIDLNSALFRVLNPTNTTSSVNYLDTSSIGLLSVINTGSQSAINWNSDTDTVTSGSDAIGANAAINISTFKVDTKYYEYIIFDSDQTANESAIRTNIETYYGF